MIWLFLLFPFSLNASDILTFDEIKYMQSGTKKSPLKNKSLKQELKETKKKLEAYRYVSKLQVHRPLILSEQLIPEAGLIGATTTQAIMASNTPSSIVLSNLKGVGLPQDSKILCQVFAKYKRICGKCQRIIINNIGYDIEADLQNKDGSHCVIGELSDDKEKYLTGIGISEMAQGALALSQSSIPTVGGNLLQNTPRNKIAQGLTNTGSAASELLKEEYQTSEPIVTLPPNINVVLQFKQGFSL
jgi:hypothetical protein